MHEPDLVIHIDMFPTLDTYVHSWGMMYSNTPEIGSYPIIIYVFIFLEFDFLTFLRELMILQWISPYFSGLQEESAKIELFLKF